MPQQRRPQSLPHQDRPKQQRNSIAMAINGTCLFVSPNSNGGSRILCIANDHRTAVRSENDPKQSKTIQTRSETIRKQSETPKNGRNVDPESTPNLHKFPDHPLDTKASAGIEIKQESLRFFYWDFSSFHDKNKRKISIKKSPV